MAHRLWMGSMMRDEMLHAKAKRVVEANFSIIRRRACCAPGVMLSASSRMMILWRPGGRVTRRWAKVRILLRTTSIPLQVQSQYTPVLPRDAIMRVYMYIYIYVHVCMHARVRARVRA